MCALSPTNSAHMTYPSLQVRTGLPLFQKLPPANIPRRQPLLMQGPPIQGPPPQGLPMQGQPMPIPPMQWTPHMQGPPIQRPLIYGPPMLGPPMQGPPFGIRGFPAPVQTQTPLSQPLPRGAFYEMRSLEKER